MKSATPNPSPHNLGTGCTQRLQDEWYAEKMGLGVDQYVEDLANDRVARGLPRGDDDGEIPG